MESTEAPVFIDRSNPLDRTAAMHGVFVYSLQQALALARKCGDEPRAAAYSRRLEQMAAAGREAFYDPPRAVCVSGPTRQISWATQAWMVLSGILTKDEGARAFRALREVPDAVHPGAPYLYHYVAEAMLQCGLKQDALELIASYWGGMVKAGADTVWEVYDPANAMLSPYDNVLVNSYCHAWSCTPAYLLRPRVGPQPEGGQSWPQPAFSRPYLPVRHTGAREWYPLLRTLSRTRARAAHGEP